MARPDTTQAYRARLLELDPDLGEGIDSVEMPLALREILTTVITVPPAAWSPDSVPSRARAFGLLVVDGLIVRELGLAGSVSAELLGAGDLIFCTLGDGAMPLVTPEITWTALERTRVACLDAHFTVAVRRWPQLSMALLERSERRLARIALTQAIGQLTRVDDRLVALLWHLAERWGRVTTQGIVLPLRLTHRVLARLIGARRPSVTTALSALQERGLVERRPNGAWLLHGDPPQAAAPVAQPTPWHDSRTGGSSVSRVELGPVIARADAIVRPPSPTPLTYQVPDLAARLAS